jgi:hypothetical protein
MWTRGSGEFQDIPDIALLLSVLMFPLHSKREGIAPPPMSHRRGIQKGKRLIRRNTHSVSTAYFLNCWVTMFQEGGSWMMVPSRGKHSWSPPDLEDPCIVFNTPYGGWSRSAVICNYAYIWAVSGPRCVQSVPSLAPLATQQARCLHRNTSRHRLLSPIASQELRAQGHCKGGIVCK